jgi:hypothetical protein
VRSSLHCIKPPGQSMLAERSAPGPIDARRRRHRRRAGGDVSLQRRFRRPRRRGRNRYRRQRRQRRNWFGIDEQRRQRLSVPGVLAGCDEWGSLSTPRRTPSRSNPLQLNGCVRVSRAFRPPSSRTLIGRCLCTSSCHRPRRHPQPTCGPIGSNARTGIVRVVLRSYSANPG